MSIQKVENDLHWCLVVINCIYMFCVVIMTPVLPFWLQTAEWDIDDDANIVFTPHCPHHEFVHNDDDDGFGHNDDDDDDSIKLNDDDDDSFGHNDGNDYTNFLLSLPPSTTHLPGWW